VVLRISIAAVSTGEIGAKHLLSASHRDAVISAVTYRWLTKLAVTSFSELSFDMESIPEAGHNLGNPFRKCMAG